MPCWDRVGSPVSPKAHFSFLGSLLSSSRGRLTCQYAAGSHPPSSTSLSQENQGSGCIREPGWGLSEGEEGKAQRSACHLSPPRDLATLGWGAVCPLTQKWGRPKNVTVHALRCAQSAGSRPCQLVGARAALWVWDALLDCQELQLSCGSEPPLPPALVWPELPRNEDTPSVGAYCPTFTGTCCQLHLVTWASFLP